ncbi:MAG: hypothetical protein IT512_05400 [Rhodocyclaceae bacterium]|jgi:CRISPR-associated protein Csm4|nr:hypothetical protein [Rhodocyclaceae bacterium]
MAHVLHRAILALATPLGTPLAGDTLFGQLCWALREAKGATELAKRLEGYTRGQPWLVVSDGFPAGYLPKPTLPQHFEPAREPQERKAAKKNRWIPLEASGLSLPQLLAAARDDGTAYGKAPRTGMQSHNTLNRLTGTTGEGEFAPYGLPQTFYQAGQRIDVWLVLDADRTATDEVRRLIEAIGASGFGRDASIGLGKFTVESFQPDRPAAPEGANAHWTLAPCAPQGQDFDGRQSFWRAHTRFGRHGNAHALAANPFKTPVLMASTGAVFSTDGVYAPCPFIGQGLGGEGRLSKAEPATVHQGYAPVLPITMETIAS